MKLEKLTNRYNKSEEEEVNIIALGYIGSNKLYETANDRIGYGRFYHLTAEGWKHNATGYSRERFHGIEERDLNLFNAYNYLTEGMEMIGFLEEEIVEEGYYYFEFYPFLESFQQVGTYTAADTLQHMTELHKNSIYARRKKEQRETKPPPKLTLKNLSLRLDNETLDKLSDVIKKENKTLSDKISEWVNRDSG